MNTVRPVYTDFSAGEISPRLAGRVDIGVFQHGAQELTNVRVLTLGGTEKRPGTKFIANTYSNTKARLIPFVYSGDYVFLIELTAGKIRIIDSSTNTFLSSGGVPIEIATSYTESELFQVNYAQTYREVYLVHQNHPPMWIHCNDVSPTSASFSIVGADQSFAGNDLSYTAPTDTPYTIYALWEKIATWLIPNKSYAATGTFDSRSVASIKRGSLDLTITFSDSSTITMNYGSTYSYQGTIDIDIRPFIGSGNYPGAIAFFQGRLWLAGTKNDPAVIWASKPFDYHNFVYCENVIYKASKLKKATRVDGTGTMAVDSTTITGLTPAVADGALIGKYATSVYLPYGALVTANTSNTVTINMPAIGAGTTSVSFSEWKDANVSEYEDTEDSTQQIGAGNALQIRLATEEDESIIWLAGGGDLYIGTSSSEWVVSGASDATKAKAAIASRYGSTRIQARFIGSSLLFVTPSSRAIRQLGQSSPPITSQAEHMIKSGIVQIDFSQSPDMSIYAVLNNGQLVRCLEEPAMNVSSWDRIKLRDGDTVESVAVVPGDDRDKVYIVARRVINGVPFRFIELFAENEDDTIKNQWYLDAANVVENSVAFTTISDLTRFSNETVTIRYIPEGATEAKVMTAKVTGGIVTIPSSNYALIGLPYTYRLMTNRIESSETEGIIKAIGKVFFRLFRSYGFSVKYSDDTSKPYVDLTVPTPEYTGPIEITVAFPLETDASLIFESSDPVPIGIQTIVPETQVGGQS